MRFFFQIRRMWRMCQGRESLMFSKRSKLVECSSKAGPLGRGGNGIMAYTVQLIFLLGLIHGF